MSDWRTLLLAAAAAVAGCSLVVSTDGLAGAPGGEEAGAGDGSTVADASAEGGDGSTVDATATPFCASLSPKPKYCADFDKGPISNYGRVAGTPAIDPTVSLSPPASMLAIVETNASERYAKTLEDFTDTPASFDVAFEVFVDEYDSAHDVELVSVLLAQSATQSCTLTASIRTDRWTFDEGCQNGATYTVDMVHPSSISLQRAKWTHVDFSVSFATRTFSVGIDGQSAFSAVPLQALVVTGQATLAMGINYLQVAATSRSKIHIDNVTFDYP